MKILADLQVCIIVPLNKNKAMNTIGLHKKENIIRNYKKVSEFFNKFFTNLTNILKLKKC